MLRTKDILDEKDPRVRAKNTEVEFPLCEEYKSIIPEMLKHLRYSQIEKYSKKYNLKAIIVNLNDYNVGADKGGAINMFDDFDIDYNQQKYLIETRCSGALIKPYSAIVLETEEAQG